MFEFLESGLNTVVDDVVDGFDLSSVFGLSELETGGVKTFPKDLSNEHFGKLRIEFSAFENKGIRLAEKTGTSVSDVINASTSKTALSSVISSPSYDTGYDLSKSVQTDTNSLFSKLLNTVESAGTSIIDSAKSIWNRDASSGSSLSIVTAKNFTNVGTWQLFLPQSISTSYNAQWDKTSLQFLGKVLDGISDGVPAGKQTMDALKLANGEALNPISELLFNGIDHRTFSYQFTLYPKNEAETKLAQDLIKFFKANMTPQIAPNTMAMVLRYPNYFKIRYLFRGKENPFINKIAMCVLTNCSVNYQDNSPAFHRDGSPAAYTLSLQFREIEPIYRDMITANNY